jgi:hypothetical protein
MAAEARVVGRLIYPDRYERAARPRYEGPLVALDCRWITWGNRPASVKAYSR